jgi:hypothetical protein
MRGAKSWLPGILAVAAIGLPAYLAGGIGGTAEAAAPQPIAGQQVHFPDGAWSAVPQIGPNGKVRQCVLLAKRPRASPAGPVDSGLSLNISTGSGLVFALIDDKLPAADILDEQAEIVVDGTTFPAVAFTVAGSNSLAFHPGDAAGVLAALAKAASLQLFTAGAAIDTGPIALDLPDDALSWLAQCGKKFHIAVDKPTDPNAPPLPAVRPRSPEIAPAIATPAGPPGIETKWKIAGWDASELRGSDGRILACMIRQHYSEPQGAGPAVKLHVLATFLIASRSKGLTMLLKDSNIDVPGEAPVESTLAIGGKPFPGYAAHALGSDEIGIFPQHGLALAAALGDGIEVDFNAPKVERMEFSIPAGAVPWLRACARRNDFGFEPAAKPD